MPAPLSPISLPLLNSVRIATPCSARWEEMRGDEVTRHCGLCGLNVHNLSAMNAEEAEAFLEGVVREQESDAGARRCVRFFRRVDGTILTKDCPRGLAAVRARLWRGALGVAALLGLASVAAVGASASADRTGESLRSSRAISWLRARLNPAPLPPPPPLMGTMCVGQIAPRVVLKNVTNGPGAACEGEGAP